MNSDGPSTAGRHRQGRGWAARPAGPGTLVDEDRARHQGRQASSPHYSSAHKARAQRQVQPMRVKENPPRRTRRRVDTYSRGSAADAGGSPTIAAGWCVMRAAIQSLSNRAISDRPAGVK